MKSYFYRDLLFFVFFMQIITQMSMYNPITGGSYLWVEKAFEDLSHDDLTQQCIEEVI